MATRWGEATVFSLQRGGLPAAQVTVVTSAAADAAMNVMTSMAMMASSERW
jgi:hypothetical protein